MSMPWWKQLRRRRKRTGGSSFAHQTCRLRFEHLEPRRLLSAEPLITELMASNDQTLADGFLPPQYPDWFEVYNAGDQSIDLVGWHATDDRTQLEKWTFPNELLDPGEYLVVFASGIGDDLPESRDPGGYLHTSFRLASSGENLALVEPDGTTIASEFGPQFPQQFEDRSFGLGFEQTTVVSTGDSVDVLVPADDALGATWTGSPADEPFDETGWTTGTTGVGFGDTFDNFLATPQSPSLITGVSVAASGVSDPGDSEEHLVDGSGLLNSASAGSDNKLYHANTSAGGLHWVTSASTGWLTFDLGAVYDVDVMHLWNFNDRSSLDRGINHLQLQASTTGADAASASNFETVVASLPINSGHGANSFSFYRGENYRFNALSLSEAQAVNPRLDVGDDYDFSATTLRARFIRFDELTSPGTKIGLSEVQFYGKRVDAAQTHGPFLNQIVIPAGNTHVVGTSPAVSGNEEANLVNGSGVMNWADFGGPNKLFHQNDNVGGIHWLMSQQVGFVTFDLGAEYDIDVMHIWNYNNVCCTGQGTSPFDLQISSTGTSAADATNFERVGPPLPISPGTGAGVFYLGENYRFNGLSLAAAQSVNSLLDTTANHDLSQINLRGRFVRFAALSSSGANVGLSEVQFYGRPVGNVTSPAGANIGPEMLGVNSGAYLRTRFTVENPTEVDSLTLRIKYSDGFVAYLNGQEVARRNAPGLTGNSLPFHAAAIDERFFIDAIQFEEIDISETIGTLNEGDNILAIHGLNASAGDEDFLILPELVAGTLIPHDLGYFLDPTPGTANGPLDRQIGPVIENVTHGPNEPSANDNLVVTATLTEAQSAVDFVALHYRVMYGSEVTVSMNDNGANGDVAADDGVYTTTLTAAELNAALVASGGASGQLGGKMIRYYVTAEDGDGSTSRAPVFLDPTGSAEYFGTVVVDALVNTNLPFYQWFTQDEPAADTGVGTRASFFHNGEFYDNIFARIRGGVSRAWPKKSYKFEFNDEHHFLVDPLEARVDEINVNGTYPEKTYVRAVLAMEALAAAGVHAPRAMNVRMHRNGEFYSVSFYVEQVDRNFLQRNNLDPDGALYNLKVNGVGGVRTNFGDKKTRKDEDRSDLQSLVDGVAPTNPSREAYLLDNVDLPKVINYMATLQVLGDSDYSEKNYFLYRDTEGTGEWFFIPWDKDLSFGQPDAQHDNVWADDDNAPSGSAAPTHPFFGSVGFSATPGSGSIHQRVNHLIDAVIDTPATREMYLRRLRTVMDALMEPPGANLSFFENRRIDLQTLLGPDVADDLARWANPWPWGANLSFSQGLDLITENYLLRRRVHLYENHTIGNPGFPNNAGIPNPQTGNPEIQFGELETDPDSGNQDEEYIRLDNPNSAAVDVSGWRLQGIVDFTFQSGTVIPAGGSLYVSPDVNAFRARADGPQGGMGLFVQGGYQGQLAISGGTIELVAADGELVATATTPPGSSDLQDYLQISEIMYHPADPSPEEMAAGFTNDQDFEFLELFNSSADVTLDLADVRITEGPGSEFNFASSQVTSLSPGEYVLVVANRLAFEARYGGSLSNRIAGEYFGQLNNAGEEIAVANLQGVDIHRFTYSDDPPWPTLADGSGYSLALVDPRANPDHAPATAWRASSAVGGSPGKADTTADFDQDVDVDGADFLAWQTGFGISIAATTADGDSDMDGDVDGVDLANWQASFGNGGGGVALAYSDDPPWPTLADGSDYSLAVVDPRSKPNHAPASGWLASSAYGGAPGKADTSSDFDRNVDAEGVELLAWQAGFNILIASTLADRDAEFDNDVDGFDFAKWLDDDTVSSQLLAGHRLSFCV